MLPSDLCRELVVWSTLYPVPSAPAEQNEAARLSEDVFFARFAGLTALDREQVAELCRLEVPGDGASQDANAKSLLENVS